MARGVWQRKPKQTKTTIHGHLPRQGIRGWSAWEHHPQRASPQVELRCGLLLSTLVVCQSPFSPLSLRAPPCESLLNTHIMSLSAEVCLVVPAAQFDHPSPIRLTGLLRF